MEIEDTEMLRILDVASTAVNSAVVESSSDGKLTLDSLGLAFAAIESRRLVPVTILMHPFHLRDLRTFNIQSTGSKVFDEITLYEVLKTGKVGTIWNAQVLTSPLVNPAKIYVLN